MLGLLKLVKNKKTKMKLIRFGKIGAEKPGVQLANGTRIDVSAFGEDYNEYFFGSEGVKRLETWLTNKSSFSCPKVNQ